MPEITGALLPDPGGGEGGGGGEPAGGGDGDCDSAVVSGPISKQPPSNSKMALAAMTCMPVENFLQYLIQLHLYQT